jgi:uncharacterized protein (TIGR00369 family)
MEDFADRINQVRNNFASDLGLVLESATKEQVVATLQIEARHLQGGGIVHGGVYCTIIESLASMGAFINVFDAGLTCAGIENHTSFLRSIASGKVRAVALPVSRGRTTHLWEVDIKDEEERLVARGTVRLAVLGVPTPT